MTRGLRSYQYAANRICILVFRLFGLAVFTHHASDSATNRLKIFIVTAYYYSELCVECSYLVLPQFIYWRAAFGL